MSFDRLQIDRRQWLVLCCVVAVGLFIVGGYGLYLINRDGRANLRDGHYRVAYVQYINPARAGDAVAQTVIGNLYLLGLGVKSQPFEAARWYLRAALDGHIPAQINLGQLYAVGHGLPRDTIKAVGWFYLAADGGSARARDYLAFIGPNLGAAPNMLIAARRNFRALELVRTRYGEMGEVDFLLK